MTDGGPKALTLFHDAARTVPAYRDFLAAHGLDPAGVTDLTAVPLSTKDTYVRRYPLPARTRGGDLSAAAHALAVSSGSSGEPTVWPRSTVDELVVARRFESALVDWQTPIVEMRPVNDPEYFPAGVKHRYTR